MLYFYQDGRVPSRDTRNNRLSFSNSASGPPTVYAIMLKCLLIVVTSIVCNSLFIPTVSASNYRGIQH